MKKVVRWGVLGCGRIARKFALAVEQAEGACLAAVAARDLSRAEAFAGEFGVSRAFGDYAELLAGGEVDAVYIATLHPFHLEWIGHAVRAGKHVLCEKPLTMNLREAKLAQKLAKDRRCLLREAFMYRHHPQTQRLVEFVESGVIGQVRMLEASFCFDSGLARESRLQAKPLGGGAILDVGGYVMSFARLIAGRVNGRLFAEPVELKAVGHLDAETQTDMWSSAVARFEGDVIARLSCAVRVAADNVAVIYGESGRIEIERPWSCDGVVRVFKQGVAEPEVLSPTVERSLYVYEIESFVGELRGRPVGPREVAMRMDDTLGNLKALDWWRSEIGLRYAADYAG